MYLLLIAGATSAIILLAVLVLNAAGPEAQDNHSLVLLETAALVDVSEIVIAKQLTIIPMSFYSATVGDWYIRKMYCKQSYGI